MQVKVGDKGRFRGETGPFDLEVLHVLDDGYFVARRPNCLPVIFAPDGASFLTGERFEKAPEELMTMLVGVQWDTAAACFRVYDRSGDAHTADQFHTLYPEVLVRVPVGGPAGYYAPTWAAAEGGKPC